MPSAPPSPSPRIRLRLAALSLTVALFAGVGIACGGNGVTEGRSTGNDEFFADRTCDPNTDTSTIPRTTDPSSIAAVDPTLFARAVADWRTNLIDRGTQLGDKFVEQSPSTLNANLPYPWYYDSQRVFFQATDHPDVASAASWNAYAQAAEAAYEDYIRPDYAMPGYERHPHGLAMDIIRNGDTNSRRSLQGLRDNGPFSDALTNSTSDTWFEQRYSREVAYMIETHVMATRAGLPRDDAALATYIDMALSHVDIWTTGRYLTDDPDWQFCQSFMTGLTASALIAYYTLTVDDGNVDDRIPTALRRLGDWLIARMFVVDHALEGTYGYVPDHYGSFRYIIPAIPYVGDEDPSPDLNLLIAPLFAWLYRETGEWLYRDVGDLAFIGGVAFAYLVPDKNFNQNYRTSFDYLAWRDEGNAKWDN